MQRAIFTEGNPSILSEQHFVMAGRKDSDNQTEGGGPTVWMGVRKGEKISKSGTVTIRTIEKKILYSSPSGGNSN